MLPGERSYHPGYYAAFVLDPDGMNVEAVYHGPVERSAAVGRLLLGGVVGYGARQGGRLLSRKARNPA